MMAPMPVRVGPTLPLLLLMVMLASVVGWLSHRTAHDAITRLSDRLAQVELARLHESVQGFMTQWPQGLAQAAQAIQTGADLDQAEHALWPLVEVSRLPDSEWHLALADGRFLSLRRLASGDVVITRSDDTQPGGTLHYRSRHAGDRSQPLAEDHPAAPPLREPWYQAAAARRTDAWSPVYMKAGSGQPMVALARALRGPGDSVSAVLAVGGPLTALEAHLRSADLVTWGLAYLVTPDGRPLASSLPTPAGAEPLGGGLSLVGTAYAHTAPGLPQGAELLARSFRTLAGRLRAPQEVPLVAASYDADDGSRMLLVAQSLRPRLGLDWWLVQAGPEPDLSPGAHAASHASGALIGGLTLAILLVGLAVLRLSAREVGRFTNAAERLSIDATPEPLHLPRRAELGRLGQAFNRMAQRLAVSADVMRKQNESLLATVARLGEQIKARDAAEGRLHQVTNSLNEGVIVVDADWHVNFANALARRYAPVTMNTELGQPLWHVLPSLRGSEIELVLREAMEQGTPRSAEVAALRPGQWMELRMFPSEAGLAVFFSDATERRRNRLALDERQRQLHYLAGALLESQSSERRAIARELHDEMGQQLAALRINLQVMIEQESRAPDGEAAARLARLQDSLATVQQLIAQVRSRALDLHPAVLDDLGLAAALQWLCDRQQQRLGLELSLSGDDAIGALPPLVELACFRIAQEAINNAARHSGTDRIELWLALDSDALHLQVRDNGQGFDAEDMANMKRGHSLGLVSMRERAEQLGGRFEIQSHPGQGTTIVVALPLQEHDEQDQSSAGG
ncbi:signal transduction histidine kinase [Burkholderiales bacterium JOSHI_001]|nr:signal transduction histidine kinase [Burkholderiales bacterium JOSHI_001]